ncbi:MAG: hypothetical protein ABI036_12150, partial [Fibrobacteria bacterium]
MPFSAVKTVSKGTFPLECGAIVRTCPNLLDKMRDEDVSEPIRSDEGKMWQEKSHEAASDCGGLLSPRVQSALRMGIPAAESAVLMA